MNPVSIRYFAYGSNMSPSVLSGRRGVRPKVSSPGLIMDHCLSFRLRGLPYIEPAFATLERIRGKRVHGVIHTITKDEWARIKISEGVTGQGKGYGYYESALPCTLYSNEQVEVVTLLSTQASHHPESKKATEQAGLENNRFSDFYLPKILNAAFPSRRYKTLLVDGARHHRLDDTYRSWLEQLTAYEDSLEGNQSSQNLGLMASLSLTAGLVPSALALGSLMDLIDSGGRGRDQDSNTSRLLAAASKAVWDMNELLIEPIVGLRSR
jgi:hypothetical protein